MSALNAMLDQMQPRSDFDVAWPLYGEAIRGWIRRSSAAVVLEIGGGRSPLLSAAECAALGVERYLVNDIAESELDRLTEDRERACFDIQTGPPKDADYVGACDLVFANMVFEHVADPAGAWASVRELLRPGGVALSFNPVLFSPPFVVNKLVPERLTSAAVVTMDPDRSDDGHPKFPAFYRWCRASERFMRKRLEPLGFSSVEVRPFYGTDYLQRLPGLGTVESKLNAAAQRRDWRWLASYAYVIATR